MLSRIHAAIYAEDRVRRLTHFILAKFLFCLPVEFRKRIFWGEQYYCPVCDSRLRKFLVLHRAYHLWCPICRSLQRHRFIWFFYQHQYSHFDQSPKRMLHIAPEPALTSRFIQNPNLEYVSADLNNPSAMVVMDVCNIQFQDDYFDLILCSHVLEHVVDDRKALSEFWRVLEPNGFVMILVPITGEVTVEDPTITDPVLREKLFGQHDHVRRYGLDFPERIRKAGFTVNEVKPEDLVQSIDLSRMGLDPNDIIFLCQK